MTVAGPILKDRFRGCLLGLAVGDALGGKFEAQAADALRARFPTAEALIDYPREEIWYTDDTQMAIGVAETRAEHLDRDAFFTRLLSACASPAYRAKLEGAARVGKPEDLAGLGNGIEALE